MNQKGAKRAALVTLVAGALLSAGLATAPAQGSDSFADSNRPKNEHALSSLERQQIKADALAERIHHIIRRRNLRGYSSLVVDPQDTRVTLYWHGEVPKALKALKNSLDNSTSLVFEDAKYSRERLREYQIRLGKDDSLRDLGVNRIEIAVDGDSLKVYTSRDPSAVAAQPSIKNSPVDISVHASSVIEPASRWNDTSPYYGGAAIQAPETATTEVFCSTAFGAHYATDSATDFMLTAAHCFHDPRFGDPQMWYNGTGVAEGPVYAVDEADDAGWINVKYFPVNSAGDRIYLHGTDATGIGSGEANGVVVGYAINNIGDVVKSSGAYSGERGGVKILNTGVLYFLEYQDTQYTYNVFGVEAQQVNGANAFGQGDSGGPVFTYTPTGDVDGRGIISAGIQGSRTKCTGIDNGRSCWSHVLYTDLYTILSHNNLILN